MPNEKDLQKLMDDCNSEISEIVSRDAEEKFKALEESITDELNISKEKTPSLEYRMYCLVHRSLSPIQKGIQAQHAITKYQREWRNGYDAPHYIKWADVDQTTIVLDGGSHQELQEHYDKLVNYFGHCATKFVEPDLNNCITAVAFLLDERIFNDKKYPDSAPSVPTSNTNGFEVTPAVFYVFDFQAFLMSIGGEKNYELRKFVKSFRSAI